MAKEREFHSFGAAYVNQRSPSVTSDNFLGHSVKLIFSVGEKRMFDWDQMFQSKLLSTVLNSENNLPLPYIGPKSHGEWVGPVVMYSQWLAACFSGHGFKDSVFLTRSQIKKNIKKLIFVTVVGSFHIYIIQTLFSTEVMDKICLNSWPSSPLSANSRKKPYESKLFPRNIETIFKTPSCNPFKPTS